MSLDAHQPLFKGVPERFSFPVIQYESAFVGPTRGRQGERTLVDSPAVHSGQVHQRSVGRGNRCVVQCRVGDFMARESADDIGVGVGPVCDPDHAGVIV